MCIGRCYRHRTEMLFTRGGGGRAEAGAGAGAEAGARAMSRGWVQQTLSRNRVCPPAPAR